MSLLLTAERTRRGHRLWSDVDPKATSRGWPKFKSTAFLPFVATDGALAGRTWSWRNSARHRRVDRELW